MIIELQDTSTREIASELVRARRTVGPASGMVLTLIVVMGASIHDEALAAARDSATAHPSRVIVVRYTSQDQPRLDAVVQVGEGIPGDLISLTLSEGLRPHADSVLLPLLLPDSPTVAWWPHDAPLNVSDDPVGVLADRRITDAGTAADGPAAIIARAQHHTPGDTDLSWTRLTRWRALLAGALDQHLAEVTSADITASPSNAPALLLKAWLENCLDVPVRVIDNDEPGISIVRLATVDGDIVIDRSRDESLALARVPGQPERKVALKRRPLTDLLTEELQRLDPDEVFEQAVRRVANEEQ